MKSLMFLFVKEFVFEALLVVLRQEAKKTDTPVDDNLVKYLEESKPELLAAMTKAF